jgi:hypothetical protein
MSAIVEILIHEEPDCQQPIQLRPDLGQETALLARHEDTDGRPADCGQAVDMGSAHREDGRSRNANGSALLGKIAASVNS